MKMSLAAQVSAIVFAATIATSSLPASGAALENEKSPGALPAVIGATDESSDIEEYVDDPSGSFGKVPLSEGMARNAIDPTRSPEVDGSGGLTDEEIRVAQKKAASFEKFPSRTYRSRSMGERAVRCRRFAPTNIDVCGAILDKYESVGGSTSPFLWPIEPMALNPDGVGWRIRLLNGYIYWSPSTGAHIVPTQVAQKWSEHGWERSVLGYPITDQDATGINPLERIQTFEHGAITQTTYGNVSALWGRIYSKWLEMGGIDSTVGLPLSDEQDTSDSRGRFNSFQKGFIVWSPTTDAHPVPDEIAALWFGNGNVTGKYGYPIADPDISGDDFSQAFERGTISTLHPDLDLSIVNYRGKRVWKSLAIFETSLGNPRENRSMNFSRSRSLGTYQPFGRSFDKDLGGDTRGGRRDPGDPDSYSYGGHLIPLDYVFKPKGPDPSLHDYCTGAPDRWNLQVSPHIFSTLSLKGSCAVHDMCYEKSPRHSWDIAAKKKRIACDKDLYQNLRDSVKNFADEPKPGILMVDKDGILKDGFLSAKIYKFSVVLFHTEPVNRYRDSDPDRWYCDPGWSSKPIWFGTSLRCPDGLSPKW